MSFIQTNLYIHYLSCFHATVAGWVVVDQMASQSLTCICFCFLKIEVEEMLPYCPG